VTTVIGGIAAGIAKAPAQTMANGVQVFPTASMQAMLSTPTIFVLLAGLLVLPFGVVLLLGGYRAGQKTADDPWACGYGYAPVMSVSSGNFAQPMKLAYQPLFRLRSWMQKPLTDAAEASRTFSSKLPSAEPVVEQGLSRPILATVRTVGTQIQRLQMGDVRMYCLYIFIALAVLLIVIFR
jgi:hydrogenase-4 component B